MSKLGIIDYMSEEDYARYNELIAKATELKAKAPKAPRAPRAPMTSEQKIKMAKGRLEAAKAKLEAMLAEQA